MNNLYSMFCALISMTEVYHFVHFKQLANIKVMVPLEDDDTKSKPVPYNELATAYVIDALSICIPITF